MRGLGIGKNEMALRLDVGKAEIEAILNGEIDEKLIHAMAGELKLDVPKLFRSAEKEWSPVPVELSGLRQISSTYGDMIVNAYVVWDELTRFAWIFDTGTDAQPILKFIEEEKLKVDAIFLLIRIGIISHAWANYVRRPGAQKSFCSPTRAIAWMRACRRRVSLCNGFTS